MAELLTEQDWADAYARALLKEQGGDPAAVQAWARVVWPLIVEDLFERKM